MDSEDQISLIWVWGHQFVHLCTFDLAFSYPQKDPEMVLRTSRPPFMTIVRRQFLADATHPAIITIAIKTVELLVLSRKISDCSKWTVYSSGCWNQPASNWNPEGKSTFGRLVDRSWANARLKICRVSKMRHWKMSSIYVCCKLGTVVYTTRGGFNGGQWYLRCSVYHEDIRSLSGAKPNYTIDNFEESDGPLVWPLICCASNHWNKALSLVCLWVSTCRLFAVKMEK